MCAYTQADSRAKVAQLKSMSQRGPSTHLMFDLPTKLITTTPTELLKDCRGANSRYHPPTYGSVAPSTLSVFFSFTQTATKTASACASADGFPSHTLMRPGLSSNLSLSHVAFQLHTHPPTLTIFFSHSAFFGAPNCSLTAF